MPGRISLRPPKGHDVQESYPAPTCMYILRESPADNRSRDQPDGKEGTHQSLDQGHLV